MIDYLKTDKDFKEAIGAFMIGFSELEYGLVILCTLTEFDIRKKDKSCLKYLGLAFEQKVKTITEYIDSELPELKATWDLIKVDIGTLNRERRFLVHGIHHYYIPREHISTTVKENGKIVEKQLSLTDIKSLTNKVNHLNTGTNGINGEFYITFTTARINHWNKLVNDDNKIVYEVNSKIVSDWKGRQERPT